MLEQVEFFFPRNGSYRDTVWAPGVITSHSCDFTKFLAEQAKGSSNIDRFPLLVAPLIRRDQMPNKSIAGSAAADRVPRYFYVPDDEDDSKDLFVDFWFMQPVAVLELLGIGRVASMTDEWQACLQRGLDRFFSWEDRKKPLGQPG
jgi:hypothetical protein